MGAWAEFAACRGKPVDVFFPIAIGRGSYDTARRICAGCQVRAECLDAALDEERTGIADGMRGGLNPDQRMRYGRSRRKVAA